MTLFDEIIFKVIAKWKSYSIAIGLAFLLASVASGCNNKNNGIITIEGYEHAVILCGTADQGGLLMVNNGHYRDAELNDLFKAAQETCPHVSDNFYTNRRRRRN